MSKQPLIDQLDFAISRILAEPDVQIAGVDAAVSELLGVARRLRELPRAEFKTRLRGDLERKIAMSTVEKSVVLRSGFRTLTPYFLASGESFVEYLTNVFGAVETERTKTPSGFHGEYRIGDSMVMLGVGSGMKMPIMVQMFVPNVEEVYQRALSAGSKSLLSIQEGYGERFGVVEDPDGNQWVLSTHLNDQAFTKPDQTLMTWFHPRGAAKFIDFIKGAFNAAEVLRHDGEDGRVMYAQMRIGNSIIALNEPSAEWMPMKSMIYLYVPNVDELYAQALRAGATSISEPNDQFYGDRSAGVQDEWGNMWYMATPI